MPGRMKEKKHESRLEINPRGQFFIADLRGIKIYHDIQKKE